MDHPNLFKIHLYVTYWKMTRRLLRSPYVRDTWYLILREENIASDYLNTIGRDEFLALRNRK
jgi:hypothetical protein